MTPPPLFLAVEGLDGAGTTTQCARLARWLGQRGRLVETTREPSDGPIGRLCRDILAGQWAPFDASAMALLFAADRLDHLSRTVRAALSAGRHVITDRYLLSSLAYQGAQGDLAWVESANARADNPDLTLYLEVPVEVCLERLESRGGARDLYEQRDVLERVYRGYQRAVRSHAQKQHIVTIDGSGTEDEVERAIRRAVESLIEDSGPEFRPC